MRNISWFFTVLAGLSIIALLFKEDFLYVAAVLTALSVWTDSLAIDIEMRV